jgi:hypothetical protein
MLRAFASLVRLDLGSFWKGWADIHPMSRKCTDLIPAVTAVTLMTAK